MNNYSDFYCVGKRTPSLAGPAGSIFDITDNSAFLIIREQKQFMKGFRAFQEKGSFEMRMTEMKDIIFITFKFSGQIWMDAPYNVNLSHNLTRLKDVPDGMGYGLSMILCDTLGTVHGIYYGPMSTKFSRALYRAIVEQQKKPFDYEQYCRHLATIYNTYSSKDLSRFASCYMKG